MIFNSSSKIITKLQLIGLLSAIIIKSILVLSGLESLTSDLGVYESWSKNLWSHEEPNHLPLLPIVVMLINKLSFETINPLLTMQMLALIAWILSVPVFSNILRAIIDIRFHDHALILLCFYPLFGFSFVLYPAPDKLVHLLFGVSLLSMMMRLNRGIFITSTAIGLMVHKAMWPYFGLLYILSIYNRYLKPTDLIYIIAPIFLYYLAIYISQDGVRLGIFGNLNSDLMINATVLPYEGLINSIEFSDVNSVVKSFYLLCLTLLASMLLIENIYYRQLLNILFLVPIIIMSMFIVPFVATGYLRHSIFIIFPFFSSQKLSIIQNWIIVIPKNFLILALIFSQFLFILKAYNFDLIEVTWKMLL